MKSYLLCLTIYLVSVVTWLFPRDWIISISQNQVNHWYFHKKMCNFITPYVLMFCCGCFHLLDVVIHYYEDKIMLYETWAGSLFVILYLLHHQTWRNKSDAQVESSTLLISVCGNKNWFSCYQRRKIIINITHTQILQLTIV